MCCRAARQPPSEHNRRIAAPSHRPLCLCRKSAMGNLHAAWAAWLRGKGRNVEQRAQTTVQYYALTRRLFIGVRCSSKHRNRRTDFACTANLAAGEGQTSAGTRVLSKQHSCLICREGLTSSGPHAFISLCPEENWDFASLSLYRGREQLPPRTADHAAAATVTAHPIGTGSPGDARSCGFGDGGV